MNIIKLAWDNLWYNKTRTILNMILIIVSFVSLMLISGYNNYSKEGIITSINTSGGSVVIADKSYWNSESEKINMLNNSDFEILYKKLKTINEVNDYQKKLDISGLIGNESKSKFFSGYAYENVSKVMSSVLLKNGTPIFDDDVDTMALGLDLGKYFNINYDETPYLNLMTDFGDGITLGSLMAVCSISLNNNYADAVTIYCPINAMYDVFGLEQGNAHSLLVYLKDYYKATEIKNSLNEYFNSNNLNYEAKDWKDLNAFLLSVIDMNNNNYLIALSVLSILVFVSVMQILTTNFLERLNEFGTMRALGINIKNVTLLLFLEIIIMALLSSVISIIISYGISNILSMLNITMKFPGATDGFPLILLLTLKDTVLVFVWVLGVSILAGVYPIIKVIRMPIIEVIKYV
ncbi:FtsX-like permease family protein [uncultured Brachyspira sp.]|uniref:ABC transporter permease n=1 Tax=uncultured Brachyspira sp. TaxID=221953 RepID=UPI0025EFF6A2|nr:FtsX-like permease family protein [uncultured Brachyspira sp.]